MVNNSIEVLFKYLPLRISESVYSLPSEILNNANEIRLRKNAPISVTVGNKNIIFDEKGKPCKVYNALRATDNEIKESIAKLTNSSLYTCDKYISQGFIPLAEGGRAGVCGRANMRSGNIESFAEIFSVNLRLHRFLPDVAKPLVDEFRSNGLCGALVCSPPALGKTTFLRSAAYLLSSGKGINPIRVGVADERAEISVGISNLGICDIISGAPKAEAITILTRTMSPEVIICDEISALETESVAEAQNTGVHLIASAHCVEPSVLKKRGRMKILLESGIFPLCVLLGYDGNYTCNVVKTEDII